MIAVSAIVAGEASFGAPGQEQDEVQRRERRRDVDGAQPAHQRLGVPLADRAEPGAETALIGCRETPRRSAPDGS